MVFDGQSITLSCEVNGTIPIIYHWSRVNGDISSDRATGLNTSTLTISPVTEQDKGKYYCVASNHDDANRLLYNETSQKAMITVCGKFFVMYFIVYAIKIINQLF